MLINFATQSYKHASLPISSQRAVNCYAEQEPKDAKTQIAVLGSPGMTSFATLDGGPLRGATVMGGVPFFVSGNSLYSVSSTGVATNLGGSISGSGAVAMSNNGTQVIIVNGANGYVWSANVGFQLVTDPNFHPATSITLFDNVFVLSWDGMPRWFISNSLDGTTYNGLDFASAEVSLTNVLAVINQTETLLIFTTKNIETWYDAGAVNFPFQRIDGSTIERGCAAALSPIKEDNSVFFLGDDLIFYRLDGTIPRRVSTHAIEDAWRSYSIVSDAYTFSYTWQGHKFITLTFPTGNATWVFDIATNLWHERVSWDANNNSLGRWRGSCVAIAYNKVLIGDAFSGNVGFLDPTVSSEFGNLVKLEMSAPPIADDRRRIFHSMLELEMETGVGTGSGPAHNQNPQAMLDWSDDGGRTFVNRQTWQSMGKIGDYKHRLRWGRLGQSRDRRYRLHISDSVPRRLVSAYLWSAVGLPTSGQQ